VATFPNWSDEEWETTIEQLTLYASGRMSRLYWRGLPLRTGGAVPGGLGPDDMAAEAIVDVIDGRRVWDSSAEPDFLCFLRSVVDSKVSHLVESLENRRTRRLGGVDPDATAPQRPGKGVDPGTECAEREWEERFRTSIIDAIRGDKLVEGVFQCLEAELTKPAEMAEVLGEDVKDINNAQKRLRRKVEAVLKELRQR
jgi:hypothetical protein